LDLQYDEVVVYGENKTMAIHGENKVDSSLLVQNKCPHGVVYEDIKVTNLLELKKKLQLCYKSKIKGLKLDLGVAPNKTLGMKFNMEDRKKLRRRLKQT
jgi:hypothetical protein